MRSDHQGISDPSSAVQRGSRAGKREANASRMLMQASRVRRGGDGARAVAVTSIGLTPHLKNGQMAKVLDGVSCDGNSGHD